MKNKFVKLALFSALFGFFAVSVNSMAEAKAVAGDPLGLCPDGKLRCASSATQTWHKGNTKVIIK